MWDAATKPLYSYLCLKRTTSLLEAPRTHRQGTSIEAGGASRCYCYMLLLNLPLHVFVNRDQTHDFKFLLAGRGDHLNLVAHLLVQQGFAYGRGGGNEALFHVGFFRADKLVLDLNVFLGVQHD